MDLRLILGNREYQAVKLAKQGYKQKRGSLNNGDKGKNG